MQGATERLQEALDHAGNTHTLADVAEAVEDGRAQLWRDGDTVLITEVRVAPQKKTLHAWLAAGRMREVIGLMKRAAEWGKKAGCDRVTISGRKGWERVGKDYGLEYEHTVFSVEI